MHSTKIPKFSNLYIPKHKIRDFSSHTHEEQHESIYLNYQN